MPYVPNDDVAYEAAYSGAFAAMIASGRALASSVDGNDASAIARYNSYSSYAGVWAQAFDTAWTAGTPDVLGVDIIRSMSFGMWEARGSILAAAVASNYTYEVNTIVAAALSAEQYYTNQGQSVPPLYTIAAAVGYSGDGHYFGANTDVQTVLDIVQESGLNQAPFSFDANTTPTISLGTQGRWARVTAALTADRVVTISTVGAVTPRTQITLTRIDAAAFTLTVNNGGSGAGTLAILPASKQSFVRCQYVNPNWVVRELGTI